MADPQRLVLGRQLLDGLGDDLPRRDEVHAWTGTLTVGPLRTNHFNVGPAGRKAHAVLDEHLVRQRDRLTHLEVEVFGANGRLEAHVVGDHPQPGEEPQIDDRLTLRRIDHDVVAKQRDLAQARVELDPLEAADRGTVPQPQQVAGTGTVDRPEIQPQFVLTLARARSTPDLDQAFTRGQRVVERHLVEIGTGRAVDHQGLVAEAIDRQRVVERAEGDRPQVGGRDAQIAAVGVEDLEGLAVEIRLDARGRVDSPQQQAGGVLDELQSDPVADVQAGDLVERP